MAESVQKWLERNRPPRVKITYEVETEGAIEKLELPFIVGVLADLSGDRDPLTEFPPYKQRQIVPIDRDVFNDVMKTLSPRVALGRVPRVASAPGAVLAAKQEQTLSGDIHFSGMDDFDPVAIVRRVPDLNRIFTVRSNIRMLQSRSESSDPLNDGLTALVAKTPQALAQRQALAVMLNTANNGDAAQQASSIKASLYTFSMTMGKGDEAAQLAQATALGYATVTKPGADDKPVPDPDATLKPVRQLLGLFGVANTPDNLHKAVNQLQLLAQSPVPTEPLIKKEYDTIVASLGMKPTDPAVQTKLNTDATALLGAVQPKDGAVNEDAARAVLAFLGMQDADDSESILPTDDPSRQRAVAEAKQEAANRRFANNLILNLSAAAADKREDVRKQVDAVLALMNAAGLQTDIDRQKFLAPLGYFVSEVLSRIDVPASTFKPLSAMSAIDKHITDIDAWLSLQLSEIMHAPSFQHLEATWRGLHYLVTNTETSDKLKLGVFNATKEELLDDMEKAVDKDQSKLFKMIYEDQFGTFGGFPYSLLVGGYEIKRSAKDIEFLHKISEVAASAHAPFITAASPDLFGLDSFRDLAKPRDLSKIFESVELAGWNEFRASEDSRYVTLVMPHVLLRLPYGKNWPVEGMAFEESVGTSASAPDSSLFLWGNAAYMLAERITSAFARYNWTAAIRGVEGGGLVENLPLYSYKTDAGSVGLFCPTEVSITDRREKELNDLGFISLCHRKGTGQAAFFGGQTSNQPKKYFSDNANANAKISALLPYMLAASRFAHYIKVIMRSKIGSFLTRGNVEAYLNGWISNYVLLDSNASQDAKASYPLSQAKVVVTDIPGSKGAYNAVVFLRPHFQLEELTTSIRLVAHLPA